MYVIRTAPNIPEIHALDARLSTHSASSSSLGRLTYRRSRNQHIARPCSQGVLIRIRARPLHPHHAVPRDIARPAAVHCMIARATVEDFGVDQVPAEPV